LRRSLRRVKTPPCQPAKKEAIGRKGMLAAHFGAKGREEVTCVLSAEDSLGKMLVSDRSSNTKVGRYGD